METIDIIKLLTDAPLSLILLYLLMRANKELAEVRALRDADNIRNFERVALLVERVANAIDKLNID